MVKATLKGAYEQIKKNNPELTEEQIQSKIKFMQDNGFMAKGTRDSAYGEEAVGMRAEVQKLITKLTGNDDGWVDTDEGPRRLKCYFATK